MRRVIREPLVHFLLLGGCLFLLFKFTAEDPDAGLDQRPEIVITQGRIETLAANFQKVWQRLPSEQEIQGLIEDYIREEVFYREALAMGLDRDDTIIRRRMRQKMQFLSEDIADLKVPTEEEVQAYYSANTESFRSEALYSFKQVYLDASKRGEAALAYAEELLSILQQDDAGAEELSDPLMVDFAFQELRVRDVERTFGRSFTEALKMLEPRQWQGPMVSGYGVHLVKLEEVVPGVIPEIDAVREEILLNLEAQNRDAFNDDFYMRLRERYIVTVEASQVQ